MVSVQHCVWPPIMSIMTLGEIQTNLPWRCWPPDSLSPRSPIHTHLPGMHQQRQPTVNVTTSSHASNIHFISWWVSCCSTAGESRESGVPINTTQQVPVARTQTQCCPPRCFSPALPASLLHVVDADHPGSSAALILLLSSSWRRWQ